MTDRIRLTISVTPEAHEVFSQIAGAAGVSLGRCMGDWLTDTLEGAQFVHAKMQQAKQAPRRVMRELNALGAEHNEARKRDLAQLHALTQEDGSVLPAARRSRAAGRAGAADFPPPSNTGGKSPSDLLDFVRRGKRK